MPKDALPLTVGFVLGLFALTVVLLLTAEPEKASLTCEELRAEEWSHLACFAQQPACKIAGYETYVRYRQVKFAARNCPVDDFQ